MRDEDWNGKRWSFDLEWAGSSMGSLPSMDSLVVGILTKPFSTSTSWKAWSGPSSGRPASGWSLKKPGNGGIVFMKRRPQSHRCPIFRGYTSKPGIPHPSLGKKNQVTGDWRPTFPFQTSPHCLLPIRDSRKGQAPSGLKTRPGLANRNPRQLHHPETMVCAQRDPMKTALPHFGERDSPPFWLKPKCFKESK